MEKLFGPIMGEAFLVVVLYWILCGIASAGIAKSRNNGEVALWFFLGIFFGPLGLIATAVGAKERPREAPPPNPRVISQTQEAARRSELARSAPRSHGPMRPGESEIADLLRSGKKRTRVTGEYL